MNIEGLIAALKDSDIEVGSAYIKETSGEIDVPPRPYHHLTIDGTFDVVRLIVVLAEEKNK